MKQIKRGIILIILFIILIRIIPNVDKIVTAEKVQEIIESVEVVKEKVTNRNSTETKKETQKKSDKVKKIYELNHKTNLTTKSNISPEEYNKMLKGKKLCGIGQALYNAEQKYSVNGLYLLGLACLESQWGISRIARDKNNLFGYGADDRHPYSHALYFETREDCIDFVAKKIKQNYLTKNGKYFSGYTAKAIDKKYCTDKKHADKIIKIVNKLLKEVK